MRFRVNVLRRAKQDQRRIVRWIAERSSSGAEAWVNAYERMLRRLAEHADTLALASENDDFDYALREVLFKTRRGLVYRAVFTIVGDEVRVLRIRGPGQDDLTREDVE